MLERSSGANANHIIRAFFGQLLAIFRLRSYELHDRLADTCFGLVISIGEQFSDGPLHSRSAVTRSGNE